MRNRVLRVDEYNGWYEKYLCADFPANEIKPLEDIVELQKSGNYAVIVYEEDKSVVGYASFWKCKGISTCFLDYLGVPEVLRNKGIGSKIIKGLNTDVVSIESNSDICLILESEKPIEDDDSKENEVRKRRIRFYERNGWVKMYEMATCGMRFDAMTYDAIPENLDKIKTEHRTIYGESRTDVIVPLPKDEIPPLPYWMKV